MWETSGPKVDVSRFDLMARAIARHPVHVASVSDGIPARTDGLTIWLPTELAQASLASAREAVIVHALLIRERSLTPEIVGKLRRHSDRAQRYFANEVRRTVHANRGIPAVGRLVECINGAADVAASPEQSFVWSKLPDSQPIIPDHWGVLAPSLLAGNRYGRGDKRSRRAMDARHDGGEPPESERSILDDMFDYMNVAEPGLFARIMAGFLTSGRSRSAGSEGAAAETDAVGRQLGGLATKARAPEILVAERASERSVLYPEWDEDTHTYRPQWCRVREAVPPSGSRRLPAPAADARLRRSVAQVGLSRRRLYGQTVGDDIDLDRAITAQVDLRSGSSTHDNVYIDQAERRVDLGVVVLVDASASTKQVGAQGIVFDRQIEAALALVGALDATGARTAVMTFRSQGRKAVHMGAVKSFGERFGYSTLARVASVQPSGFTRLGAAVRHATKALVEEAGTSHKLLIVLSDGLAFDYGYEGDYADSDTLRALAETRRRQIGCVCLAVGFDADTIGSSKAFHDQEFVCVDSWEHARHSVPALLRAAVNRSKARQQR